MIVIDMESTGVNPDKHALISLGAIDLENPENTFYTECQIWDGAHIDPKALLINGFKEEDIKDPTKESLEIALRGFATWSESVNDRTLAGHNVLLDTNFLIASFEREGLRYPFAYRVIDTHSLTFMHILKRGEHPPFDEAHHRTAITSDFVFRYTGLDITREVHNALEDAKLTAEAISRLLFDKSLLDEYKGYPIPWI